MDERIEVKISEAVEAVEAETINSNRQLWRDVLTGTGNRQDGSPLPVYSRPQLLDLGWQIILAGRTEESQRSDWIRRYVSGGVPLNEMLGDCLSRIAEVDDNMQPPAAKQAKKVEDKDRKSLVVDSIIENLQSRSGEYGLNSGDEVFISVTLHTDITDNKTLTYFEFLSSAQGEGERLLPKVIWQLTQLRGITPEQKNRLGKVENISLYDEAGSLLSEENFQNLKTGKISWSSFAKELLGYRKFGPFYFSLPDDQIGKIITESQTGKKTETEREIGPKEKYEAEVGDKRKEVKKASEPLTPEDIRKKPESKAGEYTGKTYQIEDRAFGNQTLKIGNLLGHGLQAEVYECGLGEDTKTETFPKVVKIRLPHLDETEINIFQMEKETLAEHSSGSEDSEESPILPRFFIATRLDGREAYVMERLDGKSLRDFADQSIALSEQYVIQLFLPLARFAANEYRKDRGFQDLKLENFILSPDSSGKVRLKLIDYGWTTEINIEETPLEKEQRLIRYFMAFAYHSVTCLPIDLDGKRYIDPVFLNGWIESEDFRNLSWGFRFIFLKSQGLADGGYRSFAELGDDLEDLLNAYPLTQGLDEKFISQVSSPALVKALQATVAPTPELEERLSTEVSKAAEDYSRQKQITKAAEEVETGSEAERLWSLIWRENDYLSTLNQFLHNLPGVKLEYYDGSLGIPTIEAYLRHYPRDSEVAALKSVFESLQIIHQSGLIDKDPIFKQSITNFTRSLLVNGGTPEVKLADPAILEQKAKILTEFAGKLSPKTKQDDRSAP